MLNIKITALLSLAAVATAHIQMEYPAAVIQGPVNNAPLSADGSDFPCRVTSWSPGNLNTDVAIGSQNQLKLKGSAVHGGGSCQLSVTYDKVPTAKSTFKVIASYEGGCPVAGQPGNFEADPNRPLPPFGYQMPEIPTGQAIMAWTWFNKVGNREMYMNCAPVTLTGSGGSQANYDALPNYMVANIPQGGSCAVTEGSEISFPNPGQQVIRAPGVTLSKPAGDCGSASSSGPGHDDSASSSEPGHDDSASSSGPGHDGSASSSGPGHDTPAGPPKQGGVFAQSASAPSPSPTSSPAVDKTPAPTQAATEPKPKPAGESKSAGGCSPDGAFNCLDGKSFQVCSNGAWTVPMAVAPGTTCKAGQGTTLTLARSKRMARSFRS